jgi:hypothetical protein
VSGEDERERFVVVVGVVQGREPRKSREEENQELRGAATLFSRDGSRVLFLGFFLLFFCFKIAPLLYVLWRPVFIGKNITTFPNLVPQLLLYL